MITKEDRDGYRRDYVNTLSKWPLETRREARRRKRIERLVRVGLGLVLLWWLLALSMR